MSIRRVGFLIVLAAGLTGLSGCAAAPEFADVVGPDKPAAASSDVTGSIALPAARQTVAPVQMSQSQIPQPAPVFDPFLVLGVAY